MRIGAICSAGGGAFLAAVDLLCKANILSPKSTKILVDRECNAISAARKMNIPVVMHQWTTKKAFSCKAYEEFREYDLIFLFFTRLIGQELCNKIPVVNIHPALLPGLPGFSAVKRGYLAGCKFVAATAHLATDILDGGPIMGQTVMPVTTDMSLPLVESLSFLQKVYLTTCVVDLVRQEYLTIIPEQQAFVVNKELSFSGSCNPSYASDSIKQQFQCLLQERAVQGFML